MTEPERSEARYEYHQWPLAPGVTMTCTYGYPTHGWKSATHVGVLIDGNGNATSVWWLCEGCTPTLTIETEAVRMSEQPTRND